MIAYGHGHAYDPEKRNDCPQPGDPGRRAQSVDWQAICVHAPPALTHVPQLALQHVCPAPQVFFPQLMPPMSDSHLGPLSVTTQCALALQTGSQT